MSGQDTLAFSGQTGCFSKAGLTLGGTTTKIKIAAPNGAGVDFAIDGIAYHKADGDNITMTALSVQAASTSCLYLVCLNSDGDLSVSKGNEVLTANLGVVGGTLQWPAVPADKCPIGGFKIENSSGGTFTCGTTAFDAGTVTDTFYDFLGGIPLAPQTS